MNVETQPKTAEAWTAKLVGQGTYSTVSGTSRAEVSGGQTKVTISLTNATAGGNHPWHAHDGKCGSGGAIVGPATSYNPLKIGQDGRAEGTAQLPLALDKSKQYHVNVHASPSDLATIVACGDLTQ